MMQKHFDRETFHSANLYQIFSYVKNQAASCAAKGDDKTVSGMLLYAKTDEAISPEGSYLLSGNCISVRALDLNREFASIRGQLDGIVDDSFAS
jgi:5-methylcytosine-specific restriction enzyme subunit McrC